MAGPRAQRSPRRNSPPAGEDELVGAAPGAPIDDRSTFSHTPAVSRVPTSAPAPAAAPNELVAKYTDADL